MAFQATVEEFEKLVSSAIKTISSFAYEGHFSSESPWQIIRKFKENGYHITMIFLMVEELAISLRRVTERVKTGGHYVTPQEIEKNFFGNIIQLDKHFTLLNDLIIADNSIQGITNQILYLSENKVVNCINTSLLPHWFIKHLPNISSILK
jgi:predicted ABC-type ATPase